MSDLTTPISQRQADDLTSMRWVAKNMDTPVTDTDAPSPEAWALLTACRADPDLARGFWLRYVQFSLKAEEVDETEGRKGKKVLKMVEDLLEAARGIAE